MTKAIVAGLAVLSLLLPVSAAAEPAATAEGDLAIAKEFWGDREPTGCSSISFTTEVHSEDAGGEATELIAGEPPVPCTIAVKEVGSDPTRTRISVCVAAVHEWGHLLGEGHSPDPESVMYWQPSASSVPACQEWIYSADAQEGVARRQAWQEWREDPFLAGWD